MASRESPSIRRWFSAAKHRRPVGYMFQEARLFPHLSGVGNLRYAARRARRERQTVSFDEVVDALDLEPLLERRTVSWSWPRVGCGRGAGPPPCARPEELSNVVSALPVSFDCQAADFDLRAGLPAGVGPRIAAAVAELAPRASGVVLDLGAGTGQVGEHLARTWAARGRSRYLGVDISGPMLAVFRGKLGEAGAGAPRCLLRANVAVGWPVATGRVDLLFLSRAAHLLPLAVLVEETLRVASPEGAVAVFGRVRSDPESLRAVLRREMRRLLAEHGVEGRRASDSLRRIAGALAECGGEVLPVRAAASWSVVERAGDALAAWRAKPGLGGRAVPPAVQERVLGRLEDWVRERYGGLEATREATERYELAAIRLPKRSGPHL